MRVITIVAVLFLMPMLRAQTPADPNRQVFRFTHPPTITGMQEIATALRTVLSIRYLSIDSQPGAITVGGTPDDIATAEWLLREWDRSTPGQPAQMPLPASGDDVLRVFYLQNSSVSPGLQEIITTLRTVAHTQLIYNYSALRAIVLRGTAAETGMDAWLIQQLDKAAGGQTTPSQDYPIPSSKDELIRVVFLPQTIKPESVNQLLTAIRTTGQIRQVYYVTAPRAMAMRGTAAQIALAERLLDGWLKP